MSQQIRGVSAADDRRANYRRDPRRFGEQLGDGIRSPTGYFFAMLVLAVVPLFLPATIYLTPILALWVWVAFRGHRENRRLPMRLPLSEQHTPDLSNPKPDTERRKFRNGEGMTFLGWALEHRFAELWHSRLDEMAHGLTLGTTGAGKTILLLARLLNYVTCGGGGIYADAKASPDLVWNIAAGAFRLGREDDLLVVNYMTGNRTITGASPDRTSNTVNPFTSGSADSWVQMLSSLIKEPEGQNAVFGERALAMVSAELYGLHALKTAGHTDIGVANIRDTFPIDAFEALAFDPRIEWNTTAREAMQSYLKSLPGYVPPANRQAKTPQGKPLFNPDGTPQLEPHGEQVHNQHGFAQMYFTRAMSSLTDTYGHIYRGALPEVDYVDVVRRRRLLVIMLPALEKSPAELSNLGKINLAAIRDAISTGTGDGIEGKRVDVLENLPTDNPVANKIICDEYGYMAVEGFAVAAAQARGLGFSVEWAGQDWAGIKRGSEKEAEQIWSNATLKTIGRFEDPEGFQKLMTAVGESHIVQSGGFSHDEHSLFNTWRPNTDLRIEKRSRIEFRDLQEQIEGEIHLFWRGQIIRAQAFAVFPTPLPVLQVNRFLRVGERTKVVPVADDFAEMPSSTQGGGHNAAPVRRLPPNDATSDLPPRVTGRQPLDLPRAQRGAGALTTPPVAPVPPVRRPLPPVPPTSPSDDLALPPLDLSSSPATPGSQRDMRNLFAGPVREDLPLDDVFLPTEFVDATSPVPTTDHHQVLAVYEDALNASGMDFDDDDFEVRKRDVASHTPSTIDPQAISLTLEEMPQSIALTDLLGEGTQGEQVLIQNVDAASRAYPDAEVAIATQSLSHSTVSNALEETMRRLLDGDDDNDDSEGMRFS